MDHLHPYRPNALTGSPVDRNGLRRSDAAWISSQMTGEAPRYVPVWRSRNLMRTEDGMARAVTVGHEAIAHALDQAPWCFLGLMAGRAVFAIDLSPLDTPLEVPEGAEFIDLRRVGTSVVPADASLMAHARGMMHWRTRHRFCEVCGGACTPAQAGHVLHCAGCGAHHFPRTDPAVIMLVTHNDHALLGQPASFRGVRIFTTLAGFVEPGESLEEAVAREVMEETGVAVARVRYHSSQPWPFPQSIMLGFRAEALDDALTIDRHEILDAKWFTRDELRAPDGFILPPDFSIARRLIDDWLAE